MRIFKLTMFYLLSVTWGCIMSLIGLVVILTSLPFGKVHIFHNQLYATWFNGWGRVCGCNSICGSILVSWVEISQKGLTPPTEYDDIWFEGQATQWGKTYILTNIL